MTLTIDNFDGAGPRDYTAALDAEHPLRVHRRLNQPEEMRASLVAADVQFVVPTRGARVVLARDNGDKLFTGYVSAPPDYEYLGWAERGPVYRYALSAAGDESLLDDKTLPRRAPFTNRAAGDALKQLTEDLRPGAFDLSGVEDLTTIPSYAVDRRKPWSEHAAALALRSRAAYRAHDARLWFRPTGAVEHALAETASEFTPDALKLVRSRSLVNDVTVVGQVEPRAYVKDYFLGDGYTLHYNMSEMPFGRSTSVLLDEEYTGASLRPACWQLTDPAQAVSVNGGKLRIEGSATVRFAESIELGGAMVLQHGDITFTAASAGIIGGLYAGALSPANCFAGFQLTPAGAESLIAAVLNGVPAGATMTTVAGHRYALTTRIYASEIYRRAQTFYSSLHPFGSGRGGTANPAAVRVMLEAHDIDPNNPPTIVSSSTVLFDGYLPAAPDFCAYALLDGAGAGLHASVAFTRILRAVDVEVRTCKVGGTYRSRLVGALSEGAECRVSSSPELYFYPANLPATSEKIVVRYRSAARALARVCDPAGIAANASDNDDGVRGAVASLAAPPARTTEDCEQAALAFLDDSTQPAWSGEYSAWSGFLPGGASDILPGDALVVNAPSRAADFRAIVREVEISDWAGDQAQYVLRFATESAAPLALEFEPAANAAVPEQAAPSSAIGAPLSPLIEAEVIDVTSTSVMIDTHADPPAGGGFEARRSDAGWGPDNDRNLIGRFTDPVLFLPRLSRVQDFYLRQYDASSPPRYSRDSALLHVDYPL